LDGVDGCVRCSTSACFPGFQLIPCTPTRDSYCTVCDTPVGLEVSGYVWAEGKTCEVECVAGFYASGYNNCSKCSSLTCATGTYATHCGGSSDSRCVDCPRPLGSFAWTSGCSFACIAGWSWWDGSACVDCVVPNCSAGTVPTACTASKASACVPCGVGGEGVVWTGPGCAHTCAVGFYAQGEACSRCSTLNCSAGKTLQACDLTSDAVCVDCGDRPEGRFTWISGCNFACAGGAYLDGNKCVDCTKPWCPPGMYAGPCSVAADSVCTACAPPVGMFVWLDESDGCEFECTDGFYLHQELEICEMCSKGGCMPGFYRYGCNHASDAICEACLDGSDPGGARWADGSCGFVCNEGYFMNSQAWCSACSRPVCPAIGWNVAPCSVTRDSECVRCKLASETGVQWTAGELPCNFTCAVGFFQSSGGGCLPCSRPVCSLGMYASDCNITTDSVCVGCDPPAYDHDLYEWVDGCEFVCSVQGYFQNSHSCERCNDNLVCEPGFQLQECSTVEDAKCVECSGGGAGVRWTDGCEFDCLPHHFVSGSTCLPCAVDMECAPGFLSSECNYTHDAVCMECDPPGNKGTFVWTGPNCAFDCLHSVSYNSSVCLPLIPGQPIVMAYVVVKTDLTMNNTAESVCHDLDILLRTLNEAVVRVNECGCVRFMTNVIFFDDEMCVDNVCPQCRNAHSRSLMSVMGVSLETMSTSVDLVPINVVQQAQNYHSSTILQTELVLSLALSAPNLVPASVSSLVSSVPLSSPALSGVRDDRGLVYLIVMWMTVSMFAFFVVCVLCCWIYSRRFGGKEVIVRHNVLVDRETSSEMKPQWMPSIRVKQRRRSGSRDREMVDV
jgi:hypothetical protein